jgi:hypothetical protein
MAPHAPQLAESVCTSVQVAVFPVPQRVVVESQPHSPALQCRVLGQTRPQPPQLASSVLTETQVPLHAISSGPHIDTHLAFEQSQPWSQAVPHLPQFAGSACRLAQEPPQFVVPEGHEHLPAVHVADWTQATPHPPQLVVSVLVSTHAPAQNVRVGDEQESWHTPPAHAAPVGHT